MHTSTLKGRSVQLSSAQLSRSVVSHSLRPHESQQPGLPFHHHLLEFTQSHIHRVHDAIQPSHPRSSPSPPVPNPSQHQSLSNESNLRMRWPKYWSFSFSIIPSKEIPGLISFIMDWLDLFSHAPLQLQHALQLQIQYHFILQNKHMAIGLKIFILF